jgi:hypothetical protein
VAELPVVATPPAAPQKKAKAGKKRPTQPNHQGDYTLDPFE